MGNYVLTKHKQKHRETWRSQVASQCASNRALIHGQLDDIVIPREHSYKRAFFTSLLQFLYISQFLRPHEEEHSFCFVRDGMKLNKQIGRFSHVLLLIMC